jgi:hypothetical protein
MRSNTLFKKLFACFAIVLTIAIGCKRTEIPVTPEPTPTSPTGSPVNDAAQVTASVSGIVLDESNVPVANAVVTSGVATTTTNSYGMFIFQNISLSKENGSITAVKAGYFKGVRSFKTTEGKNHSVRLQLMARILSGTVNAAAGGTITSNGGATIIFPANAFVTSTGTAYTGVVSVYSRWIDPTSSNLPFVIPGDLRGVSTTGVENILETYGMVGAELADASGNVLKIATGKTATVSFPIPASLSATAPASIALWHFDEASARWKENGTATKNGSTYTAQVDKFSFWNCDVGNANFINLDYTLVNATTNTPLVSTSTRIKRVSNGSYGYGVTNNAGFVSGLVPKNEVLILEVISNCNAAVIYSQNIGPFAINTSLGNINITLAIAESINFSGTVLNCNGAPVVNGYVAFVANGGVGIYIPTNINGSFSFSIPKCGSSIVTYLYQATDNVTSQQSPLLIGTASSGGSINLNSISACATINNESVYVTGYERNSNNVKLAKIWKNGIVTNLVEGTEGRSVFVLGSDEYVAGYGNNAAGFSVAKVWKNGIVSSLSNGNTNTNAYSVYVSGADVYVVGDEISSSGISIAKMWKNGVGVNLSNGSTNASARSVSLIGNNVYIAGYEDNSSGISVAKLWTNGVGVDLSDGSLLQQYAFAGYIYTIGTDIYVMGGMRLRPTPNSIGSIVTRIWRNNTLVSQLYGSGNSMCISNGDVYVSGNGGGSVNNDFSTKLWKNGVDLVTSLGIAGNLNSVFIPVNNPLDIYCAGIGVTGGVPVAKVWKNGLTVNLNLNGNESAANAVYVK